MDSIPFKYRFLLLVLLPCIAATLYISGQSYDPAMINFKTVAEPGASLRSDEQAPVYAVQEVAGFRQSGREHHYTKENLYEHIDGHAEYFISAGFIGLRVTEYTAMDSKTKEAEIRAEVFDMGNSIQAFGVLADESGENPLTVSVGATGFKTSGGINFMKGRYYVKISALSPNAPVIRFAEVFSDTLPSEQDSFQIFSKFPDIGKVENTRFVKEGYRGLDFLHNVVEREYSRGGRKITVAVMIGSGKDVRSLLLSFFDYFAKFRIQHDKTTRMGQEVYKVMDKYEGNWFLIPAGDVIFGIFGTDDEDIVKYFVKEKG